MKKVFIPIFFFFFSLCFVQQGVAQQSTWKETVRQFSMYVGFKDDIKAALMQSSQEASPALFSHINALHTQMNRVGGFDNDVRVIASTTLTDGSIQVKMAYLCKEGTVEAEYTFQRFGDEWKMVAIH